MRPHWGILLLAIPILTIGCRINTEITIFTYETHHLPRIHVNHSPVSPDVGEEITFTAVAEFDSEIPVNTLGVQKMNAQNEIVEDLDCNIENNVATCLVSGEPEGSFFYRAYIQNGSGKRTYSPGTYEFQVGRPDPAGIYTLTPLRVPIKPNSSISDEYRIDVVLIRDATGPEGGPFHYSFDQFLTDTTSIVNDGILGDPIYRWRDHQLGFFVATRTGRTASFYDGRDNACGQNPWAGTTGLPEELASMEVLGVLHRRPPTTSSLGSPLTETVAFRDCAGQFTHDKTISTFSAKTGETISHLIAKHEYGHAAFGLGDEYTEGQSRNVPSDLAPTGNDCCCACNEQGGIVDGEGSGETPTGCISSSVFDNVLCFGGSFATSTIGLPQCEDNDIFDDAWVPVECGAQPEGRCPPIESQCILESAWLGKPPDSLDYRRPNVFSSEEDCLLAREAAADHPGVENEDNRLGECRQLCGTPENPCPCDTPEAWIVDRVAESDVSQNDAMANLDAMPPVHGGTCAWCVETSLCVRWQSSHINDYTPEEVWETCQDPPKSARFLDELVESVRRWLAGLCDRRKRVRKPDLPDKPITP